MYFRRKVEITEIARITRSGPLELKQSDPSILICQRSGGDPTFKAFKSAVAFGSLPNWGHGGLRGIPMTHPKVVVCGQLAAGAYYIEQLA